MTGPEPAVVPADAVLVTSYRVHPVRLFGAASGTGQPSVLLTARGVRNADGAEVEVSLLIAPDGAVDVADALDAAATATLEPPA